MSSPIFYLTGRYGPQQRSSSAQVPQGAEVSRSHWNLPAFQRHWQVPLKPFHKRRHCAVKCRQMLSGCVPEGQAAEHTPLQHVGLSLVILPPQWLPTQKPDFTKEDAHVSLCYWNDDLFPLFFSLLPQVCNVQTSTPPGSFSRAFHNAWVAVSRISGRCIQKLDPTGVCGWAVQPRDQLRLTSYI